LDDSWLNWSIPENVGPIVNTNQWDGYFTVSAKGDYAYFSSVENSLGAEDIYRIKIPEKVKPQTLVQVSGQVINQLTKLPLAAKILVRSRASADTMQIDYDPYLGDFSFMWPSKKPFYVEVKAKGFVTRKENFDFRDQSKYSESKQLIGLIPIELNKQYKVPNINFAQSKSEIPKESLPALDEIISILRDNDGLNVLIEGHTDNQGDWDENLKLSIERVNQVKEYLVKQGIAASRIQAKGWGGTKPLTASTEEEKRRLNRRVEFSFYVTQ
jgi:outer membrane protein OmpA-like peptidoglycan-associated protein